MLRLSFFTRKDVYVSNDRNERTESIYRILCENGKHMAFAAQGKGKVKKGEEEDEPQELFETIEDDTHPLMKVVLKTCIWKHHSALTRSTSDF